MFDTDVMNACACMFESECGMSDKNNDGIATYQTLIIHLGFKVFFFWFSEILSCFYPPFQGCFISVNIMDFAIIH